MAEHYQCQTGHLPTNGYQIFYRIYRNPHCHSGRRMLMLHGAGVDGGFTWEPTLHHLHSWSEVLVPDLRGMGRSVPLEHNQGLGVPLKHDQGSDVVEARDTAFVIEDVVDDVQALLDHLGWFEMDLAGYSFGGLTAMLMKQRRPSAFVNTYLLEPAFMERVDLEEMRQVRETYSQAAAMMRDLPEPETGITQFLDQISPRRSKSQRVEHATVHRLKNRVLGFSYALDAVTDAVQRLDRDALLEAQQRVISFVGKKSLETMKECHQLQQDGFDDWQYVEVVGCDHSLPFQKPSRIADIMERSVSNL